MLPSGCVPVTAVTVTSAVMSVPELVMNALDPLITHCAVLEHAPWSGWRRRPIPPPGSVSPKAPSASPAHSRGSHSCFCSSVPNR